LLLLAAKSSWEALQVIVHDAGDAWQVVLQTDHADLAGAFAASWGNKDFAAPTPAASLATAARRHDDGWAVWERSPRAGTDGRPVPFLEVHITSHLAFYEAGIVDVTAEDPYAGLMCAMHGAGLYRERYGTQPGLRNKWAADFGDEIEGFVERMESSFPSRIATLGVSEDERWTNYKLLQAFDRMSLYFNGLFPTELGAEHVIGPVPTDYAGTETELTLVPITTFEPLSPWHVRMTPFPFVERPARFTLKRYLIDKAESTPQTLPRLLREGLPEEVAVVVE
jgi:hypothetical protein